MDNNRINGLSRALIIIPLLVVYLGTSAAEPLSVLDPAQHPGSPEYQSAYSDSVVPLDARLSWKQRFNDDETFNSNQVLVQTKRAIENNSSTVSVAVSKAGNTLDARGVVKSIRISQGKIKIKHGPIDKYGMPGMSMLFKVSDPSSLDGLKKGQKIDFNIDNSSGGFVITRIKPIESNADVKQQMTMDAIGVVKKIRESQGKIKIKHGPIDKYGMPGMSMMFKVSDPSALEGLTKGQTIGFDIDNSSGGFVITRIVTTEKSENVKQQVPWVSQVAEVSEVTQAIEGTWFVQIIAARSLERAEKFWQTTGQNLEALKGKSPKYQKYGDFTRLLVAPGQSNQAARQLCQKLKQNGQDCFTRSIK
ncbi:MAG: Cu(I)/Ag(I) efflux system protein CusF [Gammaproteobacteria bacterium]